MKGYFYGWYLKCQSDKQTLAVIPAVHRDGRNRSCSIQIITEDHAWNAVFSAESFCRTGKTISIEKNRFGKEGIQLEIDRPKLCVKGKLNFGPLSPLKYHIMGPFALVPFMECRHSVRSMRHRVWGQVDINGEKYLFDDARGYWEGDQGRSFPKEYVWTQCCFPGGSMMLSAADIPMAGTHFTGIISFVLWEGREYRLATYLGAKADKIQNRMIRIVQGDMELEAILLQEAGRPLNAPEKGNMARTIHESPACRAFYRFRKKGHTIFSFETEQASFEYEYSL